MKIIQALKEIPLIEKRIEKNNQDIQKYASYCNKIGPSFKDKNEQEKQVLGLIQSTIDLCNRRLALRKALAKTNATLTLKIEDKELTIVEWLEYNNKVGQLIINAYNGLNNVNGIKQMNESGGVNQNDVEQALVVRCFDEKKKNSGLEEAQQILDKITGALEVFNATNDLIEPV